MGRVEVCGQQNSPGKHASNCCFKKGKVEKKDGEISYLCLHLQLDIHL